MWHFYFPLENNEQAFNELRAFVESLDCSTYEIREELIPESEVDILVKHTESGYMRMHNKLDGKLNVLKIEEAASLRHEVDRFYKGGIKDFVISEEI